MFAQKAIKAEFIRGDASQPLPFRRGEFSVVVCSEMLEHVPDPAACIKSIADIADQNTKIILTVPYERPKLALKLFLRKLGLMKIIMPGIEERQSEWHLQQFDQHKLRDICQRNLEIRRLDCVLGLHWIAVCRVLPGSH
ncbi:MAG: class I SAM-dependent methyltransferase [Blastochloris sp.]|nr:class I SAM-dependent methyltransferase [Blastochloris sp.]